MTSSANALESSFPALRRLSALALLTGEDRGMLTAAAHGARVAAAGRDLLSASLRANGPTLILEGWAFRSFLLADGRRQITDFLLPGDIVDTSRRDGLDPYSLKAITSVRYCPLPADEIAASPGLTRALSIIDRMDDELLRRQVVRLGRMSALERIADWLLELYDRLDAAGLCSGDTMPLPVTQEIMADALGLTSVHVNRMLGTLRRQGLVSIQAGRATLLDRDRCRAMI